jgi:micrococcal nuclease
MKAQYLFLTLFLFGCSYQVPTIGGELNIELNQASAYEGPYQIEKIVDGDTIKVKINNSTKTIRMIGIDTPETVDPRKEVQCYGPEASDYAKSYFTQCVALELDSTQGDEDKYNRLLRYVYSVPCNWAPNLAVGFSYEYDAIMNGYGKEYTYDEAYKYQSAFKNAQTIAQLDKSGLWGACN